MKKSITISLVISFILIFIAEIAFISLLANSLVKNQSDNIFWMWTGLLISIIIISTIIGGVVMYIGDKHYKGDGYLMTISFGLYIPLLSLMSVYFMCRYNKEK